MRLLLHCSRRISQTEPGKQYLAYVGRPTDKSPRLSHTISASLHPITVEQFKENSPLKRVLCVEDDRDTCEVLRFVMTDYNFSTVHSVEDALDLVGNEKIDLWVLDNWLPDGSGIEICELIRNSGDASPIIFTSAVGQRQDIERALEAGATHYIVKPYEPEFLLKTVKDLLEPTTLILES